MCLLPSLSSYALVRAVGAVWVVEATDSTAVEAVGAKALINSFAAAIIHNFIYNL